MLNFLKKNKFYIAAILLFIILYFYGNNMEFYKRSCDSEPEKLNNTQQPYLDATDDVVLERKDLRELNKDISHYNYDGLDNWNIISDVNKGWFGDHISAGGLYPAPKDLVWTD